MSKTKGFLFAAAFAAVFAANASAQDKDTAFVPFIVNVNATATAQLAGGSISFNQEVRKGHIDTLLVIVEGSTPIMKPGITPNPVAMHISRGKIFLELSRALGSTDIALYSLNGKRLLHGRAAASEAAKTISHHDIKTGVYLLSVKGAGGSVFTTRFAHSGGGLNIDVAFQNGNSGSVLEKTIPGNWTITVSASGYLDTTLFALVLEAGRGNTEAQVITLRHGCNQQYDPATEFCQEGTNTVKPLCGTATYTATEFCQEGTNAVLPLCNGKSYPEFLSCANDELVCKDFTNGETRNHYDVQKHQFCDIRDGKRYVFVFIGDDIWMAENLNYNAPGSKCYGDNSGNDGQGNCAIYGRLYDWETAIDVCPAGWHLPNNAEWEALIAAVGDTYTAGTELKSTVGWNTDTGTDEFGFSALPGGGYYSQYSNFIYAGSRGEWWTTSGNSMSWGMRFDRSDVTNGSSSETRLLSVRCAMGENYALCGSEKYYPDTEFCQEGTDEIKKLCGGKIYAATQFCQEDTKAVRPLCGTATFAASEFCQQGTNAVMPLCNGKTFTASEFCQAGTSEVKPLCGTATFAATEFCQEGTNAVKPLCNGKTFTATEFCQAGTNAIKDLCGTQTYTATQFCQEGTNAVEPLCNGQTYPEFLSCASNKLVCKNFTEGQTILHHGVQKPQFCDLRDGKRYVYVTIGVQPWMAENLNYAAPGSKCGVGNDLGSSLSDANTPACDAYGRLYNWETAMEACPVGWHLSNDAEWDALIGDAPGTAGTRLRSVTGWYSSGGYIPGTDDHGFSALPGGKGNPNYPGQPNGYFYSGYFPNSLGYWWTTTYNGIYDEVKYRSMDFTDSYVSNFVDDKSMMYSVRCVEGDDGDAELCGRDKYYPSEQQFCQEGTNLIKILCGGTETYTADQFCQSGTNEVKDLCGGETYTATQTCEDDIVKEFCGDKTYIAGKQFCQEGTNEVKDLCWYQQTYPATHFCQDVTNNILPLCDGKTYTQYGTCTNDGKVVCIDFTEGQTRMHYGRQKPEFCDPRDGKKYVYTTIDIHYSNPLNGQHNDYTVDWMAENLNYYDRNSSCYDDDPVNCETYGRLYSFYAVVVGNGAPWPSADWEWYNMQGICPDGWHVPTGFEWLSLAVAIGRTYIWGSWDDNGGLMGLAAPWKAKNVWGGYNYSYEEYYSCGWIWSEMRYTRTCSRTVYAGSDDDSSDDYGFSALPGGYSSSDSSSHDAGYAAYFWSTTPTMNGAPFYQKIDHRNSGGENYADMWNKLSLRCVR